MKYEIQRSQTTKGWPFKRSYIAVSAKAQFSEEELEIIRRDKLKRSVLLLRIPADAYAVEDIGIYALTTKHLLQKDPDSHCCVDEKAASHYEAELIQALEKLDKRISANV